MRRGIVMVLFTSLAFLITVIFLLSQPSLQQTPLGTDAFQTLEDTRVAQQVTSYVRQSLRNAAYAGLADIQKEGFFPKTVDNTLCPLIQGKPLLYMDTSCTYTRTAFEQHYLFLVQRRFAPFFSSPLYGFSFQPTDFPFTITYADGFMTLAGKASHPFTYTGKQVAYDFSVHYAERVAYDFRHYDHLFKTLPTNLRCLQAFAEQQPALPAASFGQELLKTCPFSQDFTWDFQRQGDLVFITATTKDPALFLDNLSFAFAITLNNLQLPQQDNTLFWG